MDILLVQHDEGAQLLRNDMQNGNWLEVRLRSRTGADSQHLGVVEGAFLTATIGDVRLRRSVGGASYLSQSSHFVHFGLGPATRVDRLEVDYRDTAALRERHHGHHQGKFPDPSHFPGFFKKFSNK